MSERVAVAMEFEPLPLVAAILAVVGTHVINSNRRPLTTHDASGSIDLKINSAWAEWARCTEPSTSSSKDRA